MTELLTVPRLVRPPVVLRPFAWQDVDAVMEAAGDPLIPLITSVPGSAELEACHAFIARQHGRAESGEGYSFAIADSESDIALGQIGLWLRDGATGRASLGYWVRPSSRGRGIAQHALSVVTNWGLQLAGIYRLELFAEPSNVASWRTAERAGFEREGLLRSWMAIGGRRRDMYVYSRTKAHPSTHDWPG